MRKKIEERLKALHVPVSGASEEYRWDSTLGELMGLWAGWMEEKVDYQEAEARIREAVQRIERAARTICAGTGHIGRAIRGILDDVAVENLQLPIDRLDDLFVDPKEQRRREREDEEAIRERTRAGVKESVARGSQVKRSGHATGRRIIKRF
ncbi:MAG: hypothetical protein PHH13_04350 [Candidatus Peribacteraceae bacterium]|nr:hypothetical protein [Candidatus Peribacteraceae bacterium]